MNEARQLGMGIFMAVLFAALVLGSLSLSLLEGGYSLAEAPTAIYTIVFSGQQVINLAASQTAPAAEMVLNTPTALACDYPAGWVEITISSDETLNGLAQTYQVSVEALRDGNCMGQISSLIPGSLLRVPAVPTQAVATATLPVSPSPTVCRPPYGWVSYVIRPGETLAGLAASVQMTGRSLLAANCLSSPYLYSGQMIALPYYPPVYSYPTATYRPPIYLPSPTYGPSPTFSWLPTRTSTPQNPPLVTWTPYPTVTSLPPTPLPTTEPPTLPPPPSATPVPPPTEPPPTEPPPTEPPTELPTLPPPPSDTPAPPPTAPPATQPLPTDPPPPTDAPTVGPPTLPTNGYPFP
jgi:LysM repeat protein